jgi:hypothetical protein
MASEGGTCLLPDHEEQALVCGYKPLAAFYGNNPSQFRGKEIY